MQSSLHNVLMGESLTFDYYVMFLDSHLAIEFCTKHLLTDT